MTRLSIVTKSELSEAQTQYLTERLRAPEHREDNGPPKVWHIYTFALYAFIDNASSLPIAIAEASGRPVAAPGWWIDQRYRGQGYGNELVDLLAERLKAEGVTGVGNIRIDTYRGEYDTPSRKLAERMLRHFGRD